MILPSELAARFAARMAEQLAEAESTLVNAVISDCRRELTDGNARLVCSAKPFGPLGGEFSITIEDSPGCPYLTIAGSCVVYPTDRDTIRVDDIESVEAAWDSLSRRWTGKAARQFGVWVAELLNACPQSEDMLAALTEHWGWRDEQRTKRSALAATGNAGRGTL